jgi:hypothetical protein
MARRTAAEVLVDRVQLGVVKLSVDVWSDEWIDRFAVKH